MVKDYHYLYLKCDVLLLYYCYIITIVILLLLFYCYGCCYFSLLYCFIVLFRNRCLENYGLCPSHNLSAAALSWDAAPCMTKIELDRISDVDMYLFLKKLLKVVYLIFLKYTAKQTQLRNQKFFRAGEVLWNLGTTINISSKTLEKRPHREKCWSFFVLDTLKTAF